MKSHFLALGKQTLIYGISAVALPATGLLTLPVFVRVFNASEYGALELATVGLSAMLVVADLGMASASQRSFFDYTADQPDERRAVIATAIVTSLAASLLIAVAVIALSAPLASWLFDGHRYTTLVVLLAAAVPLAVMAKLLREVMRLHFRAWHYALSATLSAVIGAVVGVALVLGTDSGLEGVLIGVLVGQSLAVVYGVLVTGQHIGTRLSRPDLVTMLRFGLPIVPAAAALWGLSFLDRVMLSRLGGLEEVGQYAVGARFAMVIMFAVTAFGLAYSPFILSVWSEDRELEKNVRARSLTYLTLVLTATSTVLALFAREAVTVIAPGFDSAYRVVGILCLGAVLFGLSTVTMTGISYARRSRLFARYSILAVVVNVVLNLILIPPLGGFGAALATATAYAFLTTAYYVKSQRLYPTPYEPWKSVVVLMAGAAVMSLGLLPPGLGFVAIKVAGLAAFAGALLAFRVFDPHEIAELRALVLRLARRPTDPAVPAAPAEGA